MSVRDQLNNAIYNGLRKNHQKLMSSVAINTGAVADHLLAQGWRPPVRVIETVEELEALPVGSVVLDTGPERQLSNAPVVLCKTGWGDWQNLGDDPLRRWWSKEIIPVAKGNVLLCVWEPEGEA